MENYSKISPFLKKSQVKKHLLTSRLYCRFRNCTESCLGELCQFARGLYHRSGITPCPEDL